LTSDLYALIALAARYWFVALIVTLLFRGWRMTVADNRRAKLLREWMGQTGCVGELILNPGSKKRVSYPIPREGVLGSAVSADVRIRHRDMQRAHAHFELREGGLLMKPMGRAELKVGGGFTGEAVFLEDGDVLTVGKLQLMLVLFDAPAEEEEEDQWFEVEPGDPEDREADEPYERQPEVAYARPSKRARKVPVTLEGQFVETPIEQPRPKPARRVRQVPVTLEGQFIETPIEQPRQRPTKRGRKTAAEFDLPFDPAPAPTRARVNPDGGEWTDGAGRNPTAKRARRIKPTAPNDDFDEDAIWRDL
jgi:hypothetical protein